MFDRIEISALKVVKSRSFETLCFTAKLAFDGEVVATVESQGHGDLTFVCPLPGKQEKVIAAREWAKSLPPETSSVCEGMQIPMNLEFAIDLIVAEMHLNAQKRAEFKKSVKKGGLIFKGKVYTMPGTNMDKMSTNVRVAYSDGIKKRYPGAEVLIDLPEEEAFEKFCAAMYK